MLGNYLNEILAGVAILILLIAYIVIKKVQSKKKNKTDLEQIVANDDVVEDMFDSSSVVEDSFDDFSSDVVEDSFDNAPIQEVPTKQETSYPLEADVTKREVPSHGKIVKDDFKEFSGERILVAEDNLINQKVLSGILLESGIDLIIANDGQEALDILKDDKNFSIVLMDAHMPRVDGFEATKIIRSNPDYNHIVVVALSGDTAADDIKKMKSVGMQEHLEKPLKMEMLYDVIYTYTGQSKSQQTPLNQDYSDKEIVIDSVESTEYHIENSDGLYTKVGLGISGGDNQFYLDILNEFEQTYSKSTNKLARFINSKDYVESDKILLDIIGVSANIGANKLTTVTAELKKSIAHKINRETIRLFSEYRRILKIVLQDIATYKANTK